MYINFITMTGTLTTFISINTEQLRSFEQEPANNNGKTSACE